MDKVAFVTGLVVGAQLKMVNIKFASLMVSVVCVAASPWPGLECVNVFGLYCSCGFLEFFIVCQRFFMYFAFV